MFGIVGACAQALEDCRIRASGSTVLGVIQKAYGLLSPVTRGF